MSKEPFELQPIPGRLKHPKVVEALLALANRLGPEAQFPPVRELAKALQVSVNSLILGVRELEQRGLLNRHPGKGIYVARRIKQKAIGLVMGADIFGEPEAVFYGILLGHCMQLAIARQERFSFYIDLPRPGQDAVVHEDIARAIAQHQLDGILVASYWTAGAKQQWLASQGVPVVTCSHGELAQCVASDRHETIVMAVRALAERGCRQLGLIYVFDDDRETLLREAARYGMQVEESWMINGFHETTGTMREHGQFMAQQLFSRRQIQEGPAPGLVVMDDNWTHSICELCTQKSIEIGRDLIIATQANKKSPTLKPWSDRLILCEFDPEEFAREMLGMLETLMRGDTIASNVVWISPQLVLPSQG